MLSAGRRQQIVDQRERVGGIGAPVSGPGRLPGARTAVRIAAAGCHDLFQTGVYGSEERPEPL